ncbi:MAG: hypothetical protein M1823_002842 [Watsoniomyces obsoletus]|nr:MAG: hypothetical protein M1823_002842 [Watsoniomyces obsoletus]
MIGSLSPGLPLCTPKLRQPENDSMKRFSNNDRRLMRMEDKMDRGFEEMRQEIKKLSEETNFIVISATKIRWKSDEVS